MNEVISGIPVHEMVGEFQRVLKEIWPSGDMAYAFKLGNYTTGVECRESGYGVYIMDGTYRIIHSVAGELDFDLDGTEDEDAWEDFFGLVASELVNAGFFMAQLMAPYKKGIGLEQLITAFDAEVFFAYMNFSNKICKVQEASIEIVCVDCLQNTSELSVFSGTAVFCGRQCDFFIVKNKEEGKYTFFYEKDKAPMDSATFEDLVVKTGLFV